MNWFTRICRQTGLMVHHVVKPVRDDASRQQVSRTVEQEKISPTVTLRRTTIEEIEVRRRAQATEPSRPRGEKP